MLHIFHSSFHVLYQISKYIFDSIHYNSFFLIHKIHSFSTEMKRMPPPLGHKAAPASLQLYAFFSPERRRNPPLARAVSKLGTSETE
jgi:hypothetical protein